MIRRVLVAAVLALLVLGAGARVATADDPPPIGPPGFTPPVGDPSDPPLRGPTYVITPGVGGSELPAPSDQKAVEDAKQKDQSPHPAKRGKPAAVPRTETPGTPTTAGTSGTDTPGTPSIATAGRQTPLVPAVTGEKVGVGLRGFAALVAMVVLFEITAVRRYVFARRHARVTAD